MNCTAIVKTTGKACKNMAKKGLSFCGMHIPKEPKPLPPDTYTEDILRRRFAMHKRAVEEDIAFQKETGVKFRHRSIPEDISENMVKFVIHNHVGDKTSRWTGVKGDLHSDVEGVEEVKCFTSDGPLSFTPKSNWDVIYFQDARRWLTDGVFVVFRVALKRDSDIWKTIKGKRSATFADQSADGRRPRGNWETVLLPHLGEHAQKVFEGTFEDVFKPPVAKALPETR